MKRKVGTLTKASGGVYKDLSNRTFIVKKNIERAYLVDKKDTGKYALYQNRILVLFFGGALLTYLTTWKIGIPVAVGFTVLIEVYFRFIYINNLDEFEYENIEEDRQNNMFANYPMPKKIGALIIHIGLIACILINFFETVYVIPFNQWESKQIFVVIGSVAVLGICLFNLTKIIAALGMKPEEVPKVNDKEK